MAQIEKETGEIRRAHSLPGDGVNIPYNKIQVHHPSIAKAGEQAIDAKPHGGAVCNQAGKMEQIPPVGTGRAEPVPHRRGKMGLGPLTKHSSVLQQAGQEPDHTQQNICHGVQGPCPKIKLLTKRSVRRS